MYWKISPALVFGILVACALGTISAALMFGSLSWSFNELFAILSGRGDTLSDTVIFELRLPRALSAFCVGGLLALAGALMQVLLRNPLADPYILGVSGGSAFGALLMILVGAGGFWIAGASFAGAMLSISLVFALAHGRGGWTPTRLLLTGVVVAAGWGALISLLLALGPDSSLRSMMFWMMGDLSFATAPGLSALVLLGGVVACFPFARQLNLLARGEQLAKTLGVDARPLNLLLYFLASLFTATAVMQGGSIGFVGLVIPHMLRLVVGADHRVLLPAAVLAGGSLLTLADLLARTVIAPRQLPVGVITACIGVPIFLYLLNKSRSQA